MLIFSFIYAIFLCSDFALPPWIKFWLSIVFPVTKKKKPKKV